MLRIITQLADAHAELLRIRDRLPPRENASYDRAVRDILERVREGGDRALLEAAAEGGSKPRSLKVSGSDLDAAYQQISKDLLYSIQQSCQQLEHFHRQRLPKSWVHFGETGVTIARRYVPVRVAGLYVDGCKGTGLGSLLAQAIPARVARVGRTIAAIAPDGDRKIHPALLVAAQEAGIQEIYGLGGVEAIAAFAYGTETIPRVDAISGAGDFSVTLAKKLLQGTVGTDSPVEKPDLAIVADDSASAAQIAADLLAHIELDPNAAVVVLTPDISLAREVQQQVADRLARYNQDITIEKAIAHHGLIVLVESLERAAKLVDEMAPQFLLLAVAEPWELAEKVRYAGTIYLGHQTPAAIGDYIGGGLQRGPAAETLYQSCQVGVETFLRPSILLEHSAESLLALAPALAALAEFDARPGAVESLQVRRDRPPSPPSEF